MKLAQTVLALAASGGAGVTPPQPLVIPTIVSYGVQQVPPGSILVAPGALSYTVQTIPTAEILVSPKTYAGPFTPIHPVGPPYGEFWTCQPAPPNSRY